MTILVLHKNSLHSYYKSSPDKQTRDYAENPVLLKSHDAHEKSLETVVNTLSNTNVKFDIFHRSKRPDLSSYDLIVTVGGDGTFIEAGHFIRGIPLLGINSDPDKSRGIYTCCNAYEFADVLDSLECFPRTKVQRLQLTFNDKVLDELVLNDILVYHENRGNFRHDLIEEGKLHEIRDCYDLFVATPSGSTGGVHNFGSEVLPLDADFVYFITGSRDKIGEFVPSTHLELVSKTREGIMRVDGEHVWYRFGLGDRIVCEYGEPLEMVGDLDENRRLKGFK